MSEWQRSNHQRQECVSETVCRQKLCPACSSVPQHSLRAVAVHLGKQWADAPRGAPKQVKTGAHTKPLVPAVSETLRLGVMFVVYQVPM